MAEQAAEAGGPGGDYEDLPYDSMPFAHTQPSSLGAIARLYGLAAAPASDCRVLELGCASGGNIIPLAERYPAARFTGIDLSNRHVATASDRIAALGLNNIQVRQGDIAAPGIVAGEYDYILCHGLYSWVPPAAQDCILDICGRHLAAGGVAYISYNVLPGWHLRAVVRDIFQMHARGHDGPRQRIAAGRALLGRVAAISSEVTPYGELIRNEAKSLAAYPDSYILGEFLAPENRPCYFREFEASASQAGLAYLADTDLRSSLPESVSPEFAKLLSEMAGADWRMAEHYFDLFRGRQFRQSVLVRTADASHSRPKVNPERIAALHFSSELRLESGPSNDQAMTLREPKGKSITTNDPMAARALECLGAAFPETRSLDQLLGHLAVQDGTDGSEVRNRVLATLARLVVTGLAEMSSSPVVTGRASDTRPIVWSIARHDLTVGQPWVTSLRHIPVKLDPFTSALLPLLNGHNDRASLISRMRELRTQPDLRGATGPLSGEANGQFAETDLADHLERALMSLERHALLDRTESQMVPGALDPQAAGR